MPGPQPEPAQQSRFVSLNPPGFTVTESGWTASQVAVKFASIIEPIPHPANRDQMAGILWIGLDFLPQVVHVGVHDAVRYKGVLAPDFLIQLIDRQHSAPVSQEGPQQLELHGCKIYRLAASPCLAAPQVDLGIVELVDFRR